MNENIQTSDVKEIASENMAKALLESLLLFVQQLPKPWAQMTEAEQNDVIDALRKGVRESTDCAVRLISANGAISVDGELEQVTIKDGIKAQVTISRNAQNLSELFDAVGKEVLIVCAGNPVYDKGLDEVHGESDQRGLDLGEEYAPEPHPSNLLLGE